MGAPEGDAQVVDPPQPGQAEHLVAAAVHRQRAVPADELVQAAQTGDPLGAHPLQQVEEVRHQEPRSGRLQHVLAQALHRAQRADRHEGRRLHLAVGRGQAAETGEPVTRDDTEAEAVCMELAAGLSGRLRRQRVRGPAHPALRSVPCKPLQLRSISVTSTSSGSARMNSESSIGSFRTTSSRVTNRSSPLGRTILNSPRQKAHRVDPEVDLPDPFLDAPVVRRQVQIVGIPLVLGELRLHGEVLQQRFEVARGPHVLEHLLRHASNRGPPCGADIDVPGDRHVAVDGHDHRLRLHDLPAESVRRPVTEPASLFHRLEEKLAFPPLDQPRLQGRDQVLLVLHPLDQPVEAFAQTEAPPPSDRAARRERRATERGG